MPIYIFSGDNDFLISQEIDALLEKHLSPSFELFNYSEYQPTEMEQALLTMNQPPIGHGFRVVHLNQCPWFSAIDDLSIAQIEQALLGLPSTTVLILSTKTIDRRLKIVKLLIDAATQVKELKTISPWDTQRLQEQLLSVATKVEVALSKDAANQLIQSVGNNTRLLEKELEKLKTFCGELLINGEDVKQLVDNRASTSIDLAKACLRQDLDKALSLLNDLLEIGEAPPKILASLITLFRQWSWIKALVEEGISESWELSAHTGIYKGRCYYLRKEVQDISLAQLLYCQSVLLFANIALSSGNKDLKLYIIQLCQ